MVWASSPEEEKMQEDAEWSVKICPEPSNRERKKKAMARSRVIND